MLGLVPITPVLQQTSAALTRVGIVCTKQRHVRMLPSCCTDCRWVRSELLLHPSLSIQCELDAFNPSACYKSCFQ